MTDVPVRTSDGFKVGDRVEVKLNGVDERYIGHIVDPPPSGREGVVFGPTDSEGREWFWIAAPGRSVTPWYPHSLTRLSDPDGAS